MGLKILDVLKFDEELYVRKSVSNHLNDITKDHPDLVIQTLKDWQKNCPEKHLKKLDWIQKQALRTLIKQGYKPALDLMGYGQKALIKISPLRLNKTKVKTNETLTFEMQIQSISPKSQKIAIDYIVQYKKANNTLSPKVFKLKVINLKPNEKIILRKNHSLKPVTTRKHYSGLHKIQIQVNGNILVSADWYLKV